MVRIRELTVLPDGTKRVRVEALEAAGGDVHQGWISFVKSDGSPVLKAIAGPNLNVVEGFEAKLAALDNNRYNDCFAQPTSAICQPATLRVQEEPEEMEPG